MIRAAIISALILLQCDAQTVNIWTEQPKPVFIQDGNRILLIKCKFTADAPRVWLIIEAHNGHDFNERGFDPSYTRLLCDYEPLFRKLPNGQWEIGFRSAIAKDLP